MHTAHRGHDQDEGVVVLDIESSEVLDELDLALPVVVLDDTYVTR